MVLELSANQSVGNDLQVRALHAAFTIQKKGKVIRLLITIYGIIIFMPILWIGIIEKKETMEVTDRKGLSYLAIPSRHQITCKLTAYE